MAEVDKENMKVVYLELAAGTSMPRHIATGDACLVVEKGMALLIYRDETRELTKGIVTVIPANQQHMLKIIKDFKAYIVLTANADIEYPVFGSDCIS
ncbi:cupin domain-containing protein [Mucilaginibacter terrigena]|uniref:Cupin domain-containing protein n=1 Tax=Mucilaginibacter terrigena TaxID=2492395 RepID=A0A4Q5LRJ9_9SPHI|nr:cupin domain-containing protein [Mucilaginibacter terrigena]RYU92176.1 cupin domain-containing protein [Mucilaginibacter terrigena]